MEARGALPPERGVQSEARRGDAALRPALQRVPELAGGLRFRDLSRDQAGAAGRRGCFRAGQRQPPARADRAARLAQAPRHARQGPVAVRGTGYRCLWPREAPVTLTVRVTPPLVSFAPLAFKLFCAARQYAEHSSPLALSPRLRSFLSLPATR